MEKNLEGMRESLLRRGAPNPPLEFEFCMEENSNRHKGRPRTESSLRERETDWKNCLGERGSRSILKTDTAGLTGIKNWSNQSSQTARQIVQKWTISSQRRI
jgi:hypothetical protein